MLNENPELRKNVNAFKAIIAVPETINADPEKLYAQDGAPKIVIYVIGKENTQNLLNELYKEFKDEEGQGVPAYNEKITDFIYVTQGNRNEKQAFAQEMEKIANEIENTKKIIGKKIENEPGDEYFMRFVRSFWELYKKYDKLEKNHWRI